VVHAVEESLQIHVHHDATTLLHVSLCLTDRSVGTTTGPEAVAVFRESRIELRLQDLQQGLLDKAVEHRRDPQFSGPSATLGDLLSPHRTGSVGPVEQARPDLLPVLPEVRQELLHRHPVHAGTASVLLHSPQRGLHVPALEHLLHQAACSWTLGSLDRRRRFVAPRYARGFTPTLPRELQLPGHLTLVAFEVHGRLVLLLVRAFSGSRHLSGRRRRPERLASVRRTNRACSFPAHGFHEDAYRDVREGISETRPTRPISPRSFAVGSDVHPRQRQRRWRCDQRRRTIQRSSWLKSLRT
jgi:hypothetical protein